MTVQDPRETREDGAPDHLKQASTIIGWISGLLAGTAALLYASGYIVSRSHLNSLGIGSIVAFPKEQYLYEGARFFLDLTQQAALIGLYLIVPGIVVLSLGLAYRRTGHYAKSAATCANLATGQRLALWQGIAYAVLLGALAYCVETELASTIQLFSINDLLFGQESALLPSPDAADTVIIRQRILTGDTRHLAQEYVNRVLSLVKSGALVYLSWKITTGWRFRILFAAPFASLLLLYVILLPVVYGIVKHPTSFPRISFHLADTPAKETTTEYLLLENTEKEFVVWDPSGKKIIWLPKEGIRSAEIGSSRKLFTARN